MQDLARTSAWDVDKFRRRMMETSFERSGGLTPPERRRRRRAPEQAVVSFAARASWPLLCCATIGSALALGALHAPTLLVTAAFVFASAALVTVSRRPTAIPWPAWVAFGLAAYTAFQALPLPASWVRALSPKAAEVWQQAFEMAPGGGWMSLSLDRSATWVEALKWYMYGAAFVAAAGFGASRSMARGLLLAVAAPLAVAVVTLAHGLAGASTIYGFYEPTVARSIWHTGPLLNPNHLASFLNFGIFCGMGLLVARRRIVPIGAIGLAVAFLIPSAIVSGSRGGMIGLAVGLAVFMLALPKERYADRDFGPVATRTLLAILSLVFVTAVAFTALLASEQTLRQLYDVNVDKLRLLTWCRGMISDHFWFGVGRGAFESAFSAYRSGTSNEIYTHPENLPVQWLGEWGVPVAISAAVALGWTLRPGRLGVRWSVLASGAIAATSAIVAQNFVDFGLEVPAIALTVSVALGVCWGHANGRQRGVEVSTRSARSWTTWGLVTGGIVLGTLVLSTGFEPLVYERRQLAADYAELKGESAGELKELRAATLEAVRSHPAEPYFYRMGALLSWRLGEDPMPWLQRALERGPEQGRTHLLVARVLASRKALRQALFELRLASTFDPNLVPAAARAAGTWGQGYEDLIRAVPEGEAGVQMLTVMVRQAGGDPESREQLLMELVSRDSRRVLSLVALSAFYVQELERGEKSSRCAGDSTADCRVKAERWLTALDQVAPVDSEGLLLRARLLQMSGAGEAAVALLTERCSTVALSARLRCLQKRLELSARRPGSLELSLAARDYVTEACTESEPCVAALERVADMNGSRGNWQEALTYYERAARERPDDGLWLKVARSAARAGAPGRVANALNRIRSRARFEPEYSKLLQAAAAGRVGERSD
jgi:tetratricopeptide (TPR) repeat protein